jgi:glycosyltransferase involved in cell wall biosynthesis
MTSNMNIRSKKRSILFIGNFLSASGGTRSISEDLAYRLGTNGWNTITTSSLTTRSLRPIDMALSVIRYRTQYDLAHIDVFSGTAFYWAEIVATLLRQLRKPYVITLRGGNLGEFARKAPNRLANVVRRAILVTSPSKFLSLELYSLWSDIVYLPNAIDLDNYRFVARPSPTARLTWLRALHPIYSPWTAVEAVATLKDDFPSVTLMMIGPYKDAPTLARLQHLVADLEIGDRVQLVGAVPKARVGEWLNKSDIFINTTLFESFGVSVLEAAACGLPIVSSNVGELPYLWEDGVDALLVPASDPSATADAVRRLLTEPGLAEHLSNNARVKAEDFDWSSILPKWESILTHVINSY